MKKIFAFSSIFLLIDQVTKFIIVNILEHGGEVEVIPSFFSIAHVRNYGAAFSILQNNLLFLISASILALVIIIFMFIKDQTIKKYDVLVFAMLIGGIMGNLIDRIFRGYVVDFLSFDFFGYHFPVFNLADTFIVCSIAYILIFGDWSEKNEDKSWGNR